MSDNKDSKQATKTYTLLSGTHLSKGKRYYKGDAVELTDEQAARFEPGRLQQLGGKVSASQSATNETTNTTTTVNNPVDVATMLDQPPIKAITDINALTSVETLNDVKTAEESGQKRAGVVNAVVARIKEVSKTSGGGAK